MATSTIFKNFTQPVENKSLMLIAKDIASDKYKAEIVEIRSLLAQGKKDEADAKKKNLLAFTPSAVFEEKRQMPFLKMYNGFVHLDFDKLTPEQLQAAFAIISSIPYTFVCFISPSGNGLKVLIEVNTGLENHEQAYSEVTKFYEKATGLKADPSCKDVTRLCFVSYDPDLYKNIANDKFIVQLPNTILTAAVEVAQPIPQVSIKESTEPEDLNTAFIFNQQIQFTNQKDTYAEGNRNKYIYLLASNCNRAGLLQSDTQTLCEKGYDLSSSEIKTAVASAYTHHKTEFNKFPPKPQETPKEDSEKELEETKMPTFPDEIYSSLPTFLQSITDVATTKEEKDILLLGSLVTLSVAFPKITGRYGENNMNANLFLFITAKASAGKGTLVHCQKLVEPIHDELRGQAKLLKNQYDCDMMEYNANKKNNASAEKPNKPPQQMLIIPANNSSTGFFELLNDSDSNGLIFETEADTLSKSFKTDYGDYSDGFRSAFQHEPHRFYRRTDKEYVEIKHPALSVMLSGTHKQIVTLIPDAENGLFSRFMFYMMNMGYEWKDVFASTTEDGLEVHFKNLGKQFYHFYQTLQSLPSISFSLTNEQQVIFNKYFKDKQAYYIATQDENYIATVRRLGLIAFRITMIFSALRIMESGEISTKLICEDIDLDNTLKMTDVLIQHASHIYSNLITQIPEIKPKSNNRKVIFLANLPKTFNRQTYLEVATKLNIPDKTVQRYIKDFVSANIILSTARDSYQYPNSTITQ